MAIKITLNLRQSAADYLDGYGAGAKVYLYSAATQAGSYSAVGSGTAIVSGTERYEVWDALGTDGLWYKTRVGNTGGTSFSDYSDAFQATALAAYASLDQLVASMELPDEARYPVLTDYLVRSANLIDQMCGRRFYRDPQVSGDGTWTFHVKRPFKNRLSYAIGRAIDIVSVTSLGIAQNTGGAFTDVPAGQSGFFLLPDDPRLGMPYDDIVLSDFASNFSYFIPGFQTVQMVGVRGFGSVPELVTQANIDHAREWYRQGPGGGGPVGINAYGTPIFGPGTPKTVVDLYNSDYRLRDAVNN